MIYNEIDPDLYGRKIFFKLQTQHLYNWELVLIPFYPYLLIGIM